MNSKKLDEVTERIEKLKKVLFTGVPRKHKHTGFFAFLKLTGITFHLE